MISNHLHTLFQRVISFFYGAVSLIGGWIQFLAVDSDLPKIPENPEIWAMAILVAIFGVFQQYCLIGNQTYLLKVTTI